MLKKILLFIALCSVILGYSQNNQGITQSDVKIRQNLANINNQTADVSTGRMGYKVIIPGLPFEEQVMEANTIYEIRDVFDLCGTNISPVTVNIPDNIILKFNGGSIKNGTLNFMGSFSIEHSFTKVFYNCKFTGKIQEYIIPVELFIGIYENSFNSKSTQDASNEFNEMFANGFTCFSFNKPRYYHIKKTIKIDGVIKTYGSYSSNLNYSTWPGYENVGNACIYSNNITTLIDYNFDKGNKNLSQLILGGFELFCNKDYTDLSENDIPILYIHNKTDINNGVIELNIKSKINSLNAQLVDGGNNVKTYIATRTGIKLEAEYAHISLITIKGNIEYVRTGIKAICNKTHKSSNWFTDITLDAFTRCGYGAISDAYPLTVNNSHQTMQSLPADNKDAYFTAKTVYLHGHVWDIQGKKKEANLGSVYYAYAYDPYTARGRKFSEDQLSKKITDNNSVRIDSEEMQYMMCYDNLINHIIDFKNINTQVKNVSFTAKFSSSLDNIDAATSFNPTVANDYVQLGNITRLFGPSLAKRLYHSYANITSSSSGYTIFNNAGYCKYTLSFTIKRCYFPASESYIIVYSTKDTSGQQDVNVIANGKEYTISSTMKKAYEALVIPFDLTSDDATFEISWIDNVQNTNNRVVFPTIYIPNIGTYFQLPSLNKAQFDNAHTVAGGYGKELAFISMEDNIPINRLAIMNGTSVADKQKIGIDGRKFGYLAGNSTLRPSNLENADIDKGYLFYDTDLGKLITWNGTEWENTDGSPLATHSINNKLTQIISNNDVKNIDDNKTYMATLAPTKGYSISSIIITMGGTDITSFVYNEQTRVIYIPSVIGDVVITAKATKTH